MTKGKRIVTVLWALLLFGFTVYAALDTFVIQHTYTVVETDPAAVQTEDVVAEITPPETVIQVSIVDATPEATAMVRNCCASGSEGANWYLEG